MPCVRHSSHIYMPEIPQGHLWELRDKGKGRNQKDYGEGIMEELKEMEKQKKWLIRIHFYLLLIFN